MDLDDRTSGGGDVMSEWDILNLARWARQKGQVNLARRGVTGLVVLCTIITMITPGHHRLRAAQMWRGRRWDQPQQDDRQECARTGRQSYPWSTLECLPRMS